MSKAPALRPGDPVVVRRRDRDGHVRTPSYVQGRAGRIVAFRGVWPNPELVAHGRDDPDGVALYAVEFPPANLWDAYDGAPADRVQVDVYEHWLKREVSP